MKLTKIIIQICSFLSLFHLTYIREKLHWEAAHREKSSAETKKTSTAKVHVCCPGLTILSPGGIVLDPHQSNFLS